MRTESGRCWYRTSDLFGVKQDAAPTLTCGILEPQAGWVQLSAVRCRWTQFKAVQGAPLLPRLLPQTGLTPGRRPPPDRKLPAQRLDCPTVGVVLRTPAYRNKFGGAGKAGVHSVSPWAVKTTTARTSGTTRRTAPGWARYSAARVPQWPGCRVSRITGTWCTLHHSRHPVGLAGRRPLHVPGSAAARPAPRHSPTGHAASCLRPVPPLAPNGPDR